MADNACTTTSSRRHDDGTLPPFAGLTKRHELLWAEVVAVDPRSGPNEDYKKRQQEMMSVRVLHSADCCSLRTEADLHLALGSCVAVLDLRVFVPEVIPVLGTFARLQRHRQRM